MQNIHNKSDKFRQQRRQMSSTWYLCSIFRLRNITLGYTIPEKWLSDFFIKASGSIFRIKPPYFDKLPAGVDPWFLTVHRRHIPVTSNFSIGIDVT